MRMTFDIPNELLGFVETCSTAMVGCSDFKINESDRQFVKDLLASMGEDVFFDCYIWPGGHKDILDQSMFRMRFLELFDRVSVKHHGVTRFVVIMQWGCFAFDGLQDEEMIRQKLATALAYLRPVLPANVEIILAYSKPIPDEPGMLRYTLI